MNARGRFAFRISIVAAALGLVIIVLAGCAGSSVLRPERPEGTITVVYQPSHQTDTGTEFNEAAVCNAIAEGALASNDGSVKAVKVWSHDVPGIRFARSGSNTKVEHTSLVVGDSITGYAWELRSSNEAHPFVFVAIHNNGGTNRNAIWGYIHEGDQFEAANRELAAELVKAVVDVTDLTNGGVLYDSSTGRNDYRCSTTGKLAFYSLDENVNTAPYRVLLEIGDNAVSRALLVDPAAQRRMGAAINGVVAKWFGAAAGGSE